MTKCINIWHRWHRWLMALGRFKGGIRAFLDLPWISWVLLPAKCVVCAGTMNVASSAPPTMEGQCRQGCSKATPYLHHCFQSLVVFGDGALQHFESNDSWLSLFPGRCPVRQEMFMLRFLDCTSIGRDLMVSNTILDSLRMDQAKCDTRLDVNN